MTIESVLRAVGLDPRSTVDGDLVVRSPIDGSIVAKVSTTDDAEVDAAIARAHAAFTVWRSIPAPRRGELVRLFGEEPASGARHCGGSSFASASRTTSWRACCGERHGLVSAGPEAHSALIHPRSRLHATACGADRQGINVAPRPESTRQNVNASGPPQLKFLSC